MKLPLVSTLLTLATAQPFITSSNWTFGFRAGHSGFAAGHSPMFYIYGGYDHNGIVHESSALMQYDYISSIWSPVTFTTQPAKRAFHAQVQQHGLTKIHIHGGIDLSSGQIYDDFWVFDTDAVSWTQLSVSTANAVQLYSHTIVYDYVREVFLIHGGLTTSQQQNNMFYALTDDGSSYSIQTLGQSPYTVHSHSAAFFADIYTKNTSVIYSGGYNSTQRANTLAGLWSFTCEPVTSVQGVPASFSDCEWKELTSLYLPQKLAGHKALINRVTSEMYIYGGADDNGNPSSNVYVLSLPSSEPLTWVWRPSTSLPLPLVYSAVFTFEKQTNISLIVVFGGSSVIDPSITTSLSNNTYMASFFYGQAPDFDLFPQFSSLPPSQDYPNPFPAYQFGDGIISPLVPFTYDQITYQPQPLDSGSVGAGVAIPVILTFAIVGFFLYARNNPEQFREVPILHGLLPPPGQKANNKREGNKPTRQEALPLRPKGPPMKPQPGPGQTGNFGPPGPARPRPPPNMQRPGPMPGQPGFRPPQQRPMAPGFR